MTSLDSDTGTAQAPDSPGGDPLYETVARRLLAQIDIGALRPGDRVPSVRELSRKTGYSITTALKAYEHLEALGAIESRPRSGYFVRLEPVKARALPQTIEVAQGPASLISTDVISSVLETITRPGQVPLAHASPSAELLPTAALHRLTRSLLRSDPAMATSYLMPPGHAGLRQQIARRLADQRCEVSPEDIVITTGSMEAINLSLRLLCCAGDTILMESPTYSGLLQVAEEMRLRVVELPNHPQHGIDPDDLRRAIRRHRVAAALFVQNFNNPTGSLLPEEAKREVVRTLNGHGVPLIEDDIYGELGYGGRATPLKAYDEADLVLHCASLSKTLSPGLRVGWVASHRYRRELIRHKFTLSTATNSLSQMAAAAVLESSLYDRHLRTFRVTLARSVARFSEAVLRHFPPQTVVSRPQGGFVLWIELPRNVDGLELFQRAAREHIAVNPGVIFSANGSYQNYLRINCALPWSAQIEQALATLGRIASWMAKRG
ncbi:PLP-dependent aminotransferase family protein [Solimonas sp. K1W22B-7]|uniref:aminotransferase-like domain-containing protein n=1 Tax=Solimonas sp. K1W22B-7 TaxID=2303331 RepID=UPI000E332CEC|nr:PLP-dependent aminotransferase family protein [Solimonas sp. K1W22B-7]AXQ28630.1 PLP-dependent aminotransferase family protein [Solimonas sp. K1W22B-7]